MDTGYNERRQQTCAVTTPKFYVGLKDLGSSFPSFVRECAWLSGVSARVNVREQSVN